MQAEAGEAWAIGRRAVMAMIAGGLALAARPAAAVRSVAARRGEAPFTADDLYPGNGMPLSAEALRERGLRVAALTFDDGPDPIGDRQSLRILAEHGAPATFFCIGAKARRYPDIIAEMLAAGHEVGNHTETHPMLTDLPEAAQRRELAAANRALAAAGVRPEWFRPPFGDFDATTVAAAAGLGLRTILWTVDSKDWRTPGAAYIRARVAREIAPGAVILMHSTRPQSIEALPAVVEGAHALGYRFVTMTGWRLAVEQAAGWAGAGAAPGEPRLLGPGPAAVPAGTPAILTP